MPLQLINTQFFEDKKEMVCESTIDLEKNFPPLPSEGDEVFSFSYEPAKSNNIIEIEVDPVFLNYYGSQTQSLFTLYRRDQDKALNMISNFPSQVKSLRWIGEAGAENIEFFFKIGTYLASPMDTAIIWYNKVVPPYAQQIRQSWIYSTYVVREYENGQISPDPNLIRSRHTTILSSG